MPLAQLLLQLEDFGIHVVDQDKELLFPVFEVTNRLHLVDLLAHLPLLFLDREDFTGKLELSIIELNHLLLLRLDELIDLCHEVD